MKKHNDFDIWLHNDDELSAISGVNVSSRKTVQEWPLSVVELIRFNDGTRRIYKAFCNTPTEIEFYRKVRSRHIPEIFYCYSEGNRHWLVMEYAGEQIPGGLDRNQLLVLAKKVREIICGLGSAKPYRYDLSERYYACFVNDLINLLIKWLADCIDRWLPLGAEFYDGQIANIENDMQSMILPRLKG